MSDIVLVAGAWMGGWGWREVGIALEERGHTVHRLSLTGMGERRHLGTPDTNVETHVTDVLEYLRSEELRDVVLAGHSYGGFVITGVADRAPEQIAALVYVDSAPVEAGMTLQDFWPDAVRASVAASLEATAGFGMAFPGRAGLEQMANLHGISDAQFARFERLAATQPRGTFEQSLHLSSAPAAGPYRRALITCTEGGQTIEQIREAVAAGHPAYAPLAQPDWDFRELPTGHWPMLSMPDDLAAILDEIAQG